MFLTLTVDEEDYSFQQKQEDGTDIGSPATFAKAEYQVDWKTNPNVVSLYPTAGPKEFPPVYQVPVERLVIINT